MREYEVWSTYKVTGTAFIEANSAAEAVQKGLAADEHGIEFVFSEPEHETKMRARLMKPRAQAQDKPEAFYGSGVYHTHTNGEVCTYCPQQALPHSRACGVRRHDHGLGCHENCPTCGGGMVGTMRDPYKRPTEAGECFGSHVCSPRDHIHRSDCPALLPKPEAGEG